MFEKMVVKLFARAVINAEEAGNATCTLVANFELNIKKELIISALLVQRMRIELTRVAPYAPQTYASTSSAIAASNVN